MNKFYCGIFIVFFYGCSSSPSYSPPPVTEPLQPEVSIITPPEAEIKQPATTEAGTEAGKALIKILCKEGRLSPKECQK